MLNLNLLKRNARHWLLAAIPLLLPGLAHAEESLPAETVDATRAMDAKMGAKIDTKMDTKSAPALGVGADGGDDTAKKALGKSAATKDAATKDAASKSEEDYSLPSSIDPLTLNISGADFQDVDQQIEKNRREALTESEDARVERELKALRDAEAKVEAERMAAELKEKELARRDEKSQAAAQAEREREWRREANKAARQLHGIDKDQLEWRGLEE